MAHPIHFSARTWRNLAQAQARTATRPISAKLLGETDRAYRISTGLRRAWVPKALVSYDPATGRFTMPAWLAEVKLLD